MPAKLKRLLIWPGFIVVVAFLVRVVYLAHFFHVYEEPMATANVPVGAEMGNVAASIVSGHGFSSPLNLVKTGPTALVAPVFPYLLALVFKLFGTYSYLSSLSIRTLDCVFAAFTAWPITAMGTRAFGRKTGTAAGWLWAVLPSAIFFPAVWVWDTALTGLWMALLVAATLRLRGSDRGISWIGYGALWAVGALINPSLLAVLPFLALWAVWPLRRQLRRAGEMALVSSAMFFACIAPWTMRNYLAFHALLPMRSNFGLELWLGNNNIQQSSWAPSLNPTDNAEQAREYARMGEIPYMAEKRREALAFIRTHPGESASHFFQRFAATWTGISGPLADSWPYLPLSLKIRLASTCLFSFLAFLGALFAYRARNEAALPFAAAMLFFPLVFYLTHTTMRYRYPLDTVMTVLAVYAVVQSLTRPARRQSAIHAPAAQAAGEPAK